MGEGAEQMEEEITDACHQEKPVRRYGQACQENSDFRPAGNIRNESNMAQPVRMTAEKTRKTGFLPADGTERNPIILLFPSTKSRAGRYRLRAVEEPIPSSRRYLATVRRAT